MMCSTVKKLYLPLDAISYAPVLDRNRQVSSLVKAPQLRVGRVVTDEERPRLWRLDGLALLDACERS